MKLKKMLVLGVVAGSMIFSSGIAMARDNDHHDNGRHYGWERGNHYGWEGNRRGDWRSDRQRLEQLRAQRDYDASHHASRKKIAQDNAAIDDFHRDRG